MRRSSLFCSNLKTALSGSSAHMKVRVLSETYALPQAEFIAFWDCVINIKLGLAFTSGSLTDATW